MRLDQLDVRIVGLLQEDARLSFREIAERVGSTTPTVSARVRALEDIGLLQGYRAQLDHSVLGGSSYIVSLQVHPAHAVQALASAKAIPGLYSAHLLAGGRIVAHVHVRPPMFALAHLHQAIAGIEGLVTYDASEVIEGHEHPPIEELPENVEVPCHQCQGPIHGDAVKARFGERTHVFCCRQCLGSFRERYEGHATGARPGPKTPSTKRSHAHHHG